MQVGEGDRTSGSGSACARRREYKREKVGTREGAGGACVCVCPGDLGEELEELALAGSAAVSVGSHHPAIGVEHLVLVVPVCGEGPENRQRGKGVCVRALWAWGCMRANVYMYVGVTDEQYKRKEVLNMYEKRRRKRKKKH